MTALHTILRFKLIQSMHTHNKIQVVKRDSPILERTLSGGVDEPGSPMHYPSLGRHAFATSDAASTSQPERRLSRMTGSFKDSLLSEERLSLRKQELQLQLGAGTSKVGQLRTEREAGRTSSPTLASPRIAAERPAERPAQSVEVAESNPNRAVSTNRVCFPRICCSVVVSPASYAQFSLTSPSCGSAAQSPLRYLCLSGCK